MPVFPPAELFQGLDYVNITRLDDVCVSPSLDK